MKLPRLFGIGLLLSSAASGAAPPATFHRDIAPILWEYCSPCHRPGQSGPFPLLSYDDARRRAGQIADVTRRRYMPPWLPEHGEIAFAGERGLSDAQIELIAKWAATGAQEGRAADSPRPVFTRGWQLGTPDLVVEALKPYTTPSEGADVFWNFVLTPQVSSTRYVKAVEIRPGNARTVHHANVLIDRARSARRQEKAPGAGFAGMDLVIGSDTFDPDSHFLFWKPGAGPRVEPDGLAWRLDPGNDLVLNVHLQPTGKPEAVRPSIGLYFTGRPQTRYPMLIQLEHDGALHIPPGARDFTVSDDFRLPLDVDVLAIYPHAHYLGHVLESYATLPGGSRRTLIRIPDWDPNWQAVYTYRTPVFLPKGTTVSMRFHYDNSEANPRNPHTPPQQVDAGNQASDEMSHLWLQVLPRGEGDRRMELQDAVMRRRLEKYPADFSAHYNLGALLLKRHEVAAAILHLRTALQAQPDQPAACNTLGVALQLDNRSEEAAEQFRQALRLQPDFSDARYNLIKLLTTLGEEAFSHSRLEAAGGYYRELVVLEPENADVRNNLGIILARSGNMAGAIEQFEAALKADPAHQAARRNLDAARKKLTDIRK